MSGQKKQASCVYGIPVIWYQYGIQYIPVYGITYFFLCVCHLSLVQKSSNLQRIRMHRYQDDQIPIRSPGGHLLPLCLPMGLAKYSVYRKNQFYKMAFYLTGLEEDPSVCVSFFAELPKVKPAQWGRLSPGSTVLLCACIVLCTRLLDQAPRS